jgi:hypothetical protein
MIARVAKKDARPEHELLQLEAERGFEGALSEAVSLADIAPRTKREIEAFTINLKTLLRVKPDGL